MSENWAKCILYVGEGALHGNKCSKGFKYCVEALHPGMVREVPVCESGHLNVYLEEREEATWGVEEWFRRREASVPRP